ncbi:MULTISPECIES: hypothetical protein [unclassified Colwellia]|nr:MULTISPECIES: hypothetical protein [unclassified Colwellia]
MSSNKRKSAAAHNSRKPAGSLPALLLPVLAIRAIIHRAGTESG